MVGGGGGSDGVVVVLVVMMWAGGEGREEGSLLDWKGDSFLLGF